ncbi:MAG TPA: hypothetical protein VGD92_13050 [Sphingobacteriaceae bacterium]
MKTSAEQSSTRDRSHAALSGKGWTALLLGCFLGLGLVNRSAAQSTGTLPEVTVTGKSLTVDARAMKVFTRSFKGAESARWYMTENKRYLVKHIMNDMRHNTLFGRRGAFIYDIGYGAEKDLPQAVRSQVKRDFQDYAVTAAINVRQGGRNIWKINVEDANNIIVLHEQDGVITEQERIDKASPESLSAFRVREKSIQTLLSDLK